MREKGEKGDIRLQIMIGDLTSTLVLVDWSAIEKQRDKKEKHTGDIRFQVIWIDILPLLISKELVTLSIHYWNQIFYLLDRMTEAS